MVKYYYLLLLLVFGSTTKSFALESTKVQILKSSELQTESVDYFYSLLLSALQETEPEYGAFELIAKDLPYSQQRSLELLNDNQGLDVIHTMTNPDRETKYIAVKVPLLKGLMGYRALLTNKTNVARIDSLKQLNDLKKTDCMSRHSLARFRHS
jgi:gamma-glutamyl phosphate reductase